MLKRKSGKCRTENSGCVRKEVGVTAPEVTLIAVSKTKPAEMVQEAYDALESVFSVKIKFRKSWISRGFLLIFTGI